MAAVEAVQDRRCHIDPSRIDNASANELVGRIVGRRPNVHVLKVPTVTRVSVVAAQNAG